MRLLTVSLINFYFWIGIRFYLHLDLYCLVIHTMGRKDKPPVTRYGPVQQATIKFGSEQRFQWQQAKNTCDVSYEIPDDKIKHSVVFPASSKKSLCDNPDAAKNATGPGSYDVSKGFECYSEYTSHNGFKFSIAQRQSMAMKSPSPGPVYNIEKCYCTGPDAGLKVGFNLDSRKPLYESNTSANADPVYPKLPSGIAITIGKRLNQKTRPKESPSYDPYVSIKIIKSFN